MRKYKKNKIGSQGGCWERKRPCFSGKLLSLSSRKGFPGGSVGKSLQAMWETWVQSLGREDPLEKEMETHSNIPPWNIPLETV